MRAQHLLFVLCAGLAFLLAAPASARIQDSPTQAILRKIRKAEEKSDPAWFEELGALKTEEALRALRQCLRILDDKGPVSRVFRAFLHFRGVPELEGKVIALLRDEARGKQTVRARPAATTLCGFGVAAHEALEDVVRKARDPRARATALRPLLEPLGKRSDADALELCLGSFEFPTSGTRGQLISFLRKFDDHDELRAMAKAVGNEDLPFDVRTAVLETTPFAPKVGPAGARAEDVVAAGLKSEDDTIVYFALSAAARRNTAEHSARISALARSKDAAVRRAAHVVLARYELAADGGGLRAALELSEDSDPAARQAAAVALADRSGEQADQGLLTLLADPDSTVRLEALSHVRRLRRKTAIPALIARMEVENGRLLADLATALRLLTGQDHGRRAARWKAFWAAEGASFELPTLKESLKAESERVARREEGTTQATFYGLEVVSDHVAFVVDVSGSMNAQAYPPKSRLDVAKDQLKGALKALSSRDHFAILPFSGDVWTWKSELAPCDDSGRDDASAYVDELSSGGGTNIFDALEAAFAMEGVDTIFLLTDGDPTAGRVIDTGAIRAEIARWNTTRHMRINCISVGQARPWLRELAESTGGKYRVESR